jgi:hypothetical protein
MGEIDGGTGHGSRQSWDWKNEEKLEKFWSTRQKQRMSIRFKIKASMIEF